MIGQDQHPQPAPAGGDFRFGDACDTLKLAERGEHFPLQRGACRKGKRLAGKQPLLRQDLSDAPGQGAADKIAAHDQKRERALRRLFTADGKTTGGEKALDRLLRHVRPERRREREQRDKIIGILPQLLLRLVRAVKPEGMYRRGDKLLGLKSRERAVCLLGIALEHISLIPGGIAEINVILMGAKRFLLHELRHEDLGVDRSADAQIAFPFSRGAVIGRRCRQRDDGHALTDRFEQRLKRALPLVLQMVRLIEAYRADAHRFYCLCPQRRAALVRTRGGMQRLIGDRADRSVAAELAADIIRYALAIGQKQLGKALAPLLLDRDGGGEDQGALAGAADQLKPQNGLTAAGRGYDMKMAVPEIALRLAQDLLLIAAEAAAKGDAGENIGHRILTSG